MSADANIDARPSGHAITAQLRSRKELWCALWVMSWTLGCAHATQSPEATVSQSPRPNARAAASVTFVSPSSYQDFIRAELYSARGERGPAIAAYRAAIELGDSDPHLVARLAQALDAGDAQADHAQAHALLEAALRKHPSSESLLLASARSARRHGDSTRALAAYARAQNVARTPSTALERIAYLRELGNDERALEALKALSAAHRGRARDRLRIELELALLESHEPAALIGCARDWLALGGGEPNLSRRAAQALFKAGHAALALELLAAVPASAADARLRLQATLALGRSAECEHLLSSMPPHWLGGPLAMAEAYLQAGLPEQALRVLSERARAEESAKTAQRRERLIARSLVASGRAHDAIDLLRPSDGPSAATCEALQASALLALARDAGCNELLPRPRQ